MKHQSERDSDGTFDRAWKLLLAQRGLLGSSPAGLGTSSNELTTSQLGKLFQKMDERARELIDLYRPLAAPDLDQFTIAHLGQSLDGRIAALNGASRWITGEEDLIHNHRMRALSDAVVVGAGTVCYDDPRLTVRGLPGRSPVRVVIDPERRLDAHYKVFTDGEAETVLLCRESARRADRRHGDARLIGLAESDEGLSPEMILSCLRENGLNRIFVEGGGMTVSGFLKAGCLDRLQITIAPVILGSGRPSITLPEIEDVADGLRPEIRRLALGDDLMFDCDFGGKA